MKRFMFCGMGSFTLAALTSIACGGGGSGTGGSASTTTTPTTSATTTASTTNTASTTSATGGSGGGTTTSSATGGAGGTGTTTPTGPVAIATLDPGSAPYGIVVDATNVYWTEVGSAPNTGRVMQAKKDGTGQVTIAMTQDAPHAIAVGDGFVYWGLYSATGALRKAPVGGGTVIDLLPVAPTVLEMAVDSTYIWWTREPDDVQRMPTAGLPDGGVEDLLTLNPLANGITYDATNIYWANQQDGNVKKADRDLGNDTPIASGDVPWGVAVDAANIYWTEQGSGADIGKVMKASKVDGTGLVELASMQGSPQGIAVDGTHVYWANRDAGTISKVPLTGGVVTVIAMGQQKPVKLAIDATHVFWANTEGDTIMRALK